MEKEQLLNDLKMKLYGYYEVGFINDIINHLSIVLKDYSVTSAKGELVVYEDYNEIIEKKYAVCLAISGRSNKTIKQYILQLRRFNDYCKKDYRHISTTDIRGFLAELIMNGKSKRYCENVRMYLSSFFKFMVEEKEISENPILKVETIRFEKDIEEPFSDIDVDKMRSFTMTLRDRAIFEVLLSSGLRVNELHSLNRNDIDLVNMRVHVIRGKGGKSRFTYINNVACFHLKQYLNSRTDLKEAMFLSYPDKDSQYQQRLSADGVRKVVSEIGDIAGVCNVHPHRFRHTFATRLYNQGVDVYKIQALLGHSSIGTTMDYISQCDSSVEQAYKTHII